MNILVTGSTGLIGSAVVSFLTTGGHHVVRLVRGTASGTDEVEWNPQAGTIDASKLEGLDAVVHLAGENIATGRWNDAKKARIRDSRVEGTRVLSEALAKLSRKPRVLVGASAIGFYGERGESVMTETSPPGLSFLCNVCRDWERATEPARAAGIRVVNLRIGVVLTPRWSTRKDAAAIQAVRRRSRRHRPPVLELDRDRRCHRCDSSCDHSRRSLRPGECGLA